MYCRVCFAMQLEIAGIIQHRHFCYCETGNNTGVYGGVEEQEVFLDLDRWLVCVCYVRGHQVLELLVSYDIGSGEPSCLFGKENWSHIWL